MRHLWIVSRSLLLLCLVLTSCATTSPVTEQRSPSEQIENNPVNSQQNGERTTSASRIITLSSLTTDIVYELDRTKLVGIGGSSLFRQDGRFQNLPRVSEGRTPPNLEQIVALQPDLVVGAGGFHDQTLQKLREMGIATLSTEVDDQQSLEELTKTLAEAIAADPAPLLSRYQQWRAQLPAQSPSTLVLVSNQPILAPNKQSWAGDLLAQFNAPNVVADLQSQGQFQGYVTLSPEKVLEANPEVLILVNAPGANLQQQLETQPFWKDLNAVKNNRVYIMDYYGLVNPGSLSKIEQVYTQLRAYLLAGGV